MLAGIPTAQPPGPDSTQRRVGSGRQLEVCRDPLGGPLWEMWTDRATKNTEIFRHLFHADPDDNGKTYPALSCSLLLRTGD